MKTLPKSLHTVTVLVKVARIMRDHCGFKTAKGAVTAALIELDYDPDPAADPYGLAARAIKELSK